VKSLKEREKLWTQLTKQAIELYVFLKNDTFTHAVENNPFKILVECSTLLVPLQKLMKLLNVSGISFYRVFFT